MNLNFWNFYDSAHLSSFTSSHHAYLEVNPVEVVADREVHQLRRTFSEKDLLNEEVSDHLFVDQSEVGQERQQLVTDVRQDVQSKTEYENSTFKYVSDISFARNVMFLY